MVRQQTGIARHELDFLVHADVNLREVLLVEVAFQHLSALQDSLVFQFLLRSEDIPGGVQVLRLLADGSVLLGVVVGELRHVLIEVGHLLVQFCDVDVLLVKFFYQCPYFLLLLGQLLGHRLYRLLQPFVGDATVAHLLLQVVDEFLVLTEGLLDERHVLLDAGS